MWNLISCASGELNKAIDGSGTEWDGDVRATSHHFLEGLQFRGRSRWTANNQTAAVINSAREFIMSLSERESGEMATERTRLKACCTQISFCVIEIHLFRIPMHENKITFNHSSL